MLEKKFMIFNSIGLSAVLFCFFKILCPSRLKIRYKIFPSHFDPVVYRKQNADLKRMSNKKLELHYNEFGLKEGRIADSISSRNQLVEHITKLKFASCLEIGPFDCPVLVGENVKYFDVISQEELIERANRIGRIDNLQNIPFIDFVSKEGRIDAISKKFDLILSCHAIEHQLDFIQHLNDVSHLLNQNGYYIVICPDKRYCFDHFIPETSIADLIAAHTTPLQSHSIKSVIEHRALTCHNDPARHWAGDHGYFKIDVERVKCAIEEYQKAKVDKQYIDVHSLQFTPKSFQENMEILYSMNFTDLVVEEIYPTIKNSLEFFAVLKKNQFS